MQSTAETTRPLPDHPELLVVSTCTGDATVTEYRVLNFQTLPSGRVIGAGSLSLGSLGMGICGCWALAVLVVLERDRVWAGAPSTMQECKPVVGLVVVVCLAWRAAQTVLWQSLTPLPGVGIQLSTTRGLSALGRSMALSTSRTLVPLADVSTVALNEGLARWSVRYYLAVVLRRGSGVRVAFDRVCPRHAVLCHVYHGTREALYDEYREEYTREHG